MAFAFIFGVISWAEAQVPFKLTTENPHLRVTWIGVLQGTWTEMGIQYGQRAAKDIAQNFDIAWKNVVLKGNSLWQQGKTEEERAAYAVKYHQRSFQELLLLSSELAEFFGGIAKGAEEELDKCVYANVISHVLKIQMLNWVDTPFHPNWDFANDHPYAMNRVKPVTMLAKMNDDHDCNGFWVKGEATKSGQTIAIRGAQGGHIFVDGSPTGRERQISYVAIPSDPKAHMFWGTGRAGNLGGGPGGGVFNEHGVCVLTAGCSYSAVNWEQADITCAPGIRDFILASYGVIFSKTAREAAERITIGTKEYRKKTGRETVLRVRGANIVFGDKNEAYCVEQNARRYAIRRPGDLGELGGNYLVIANHFKYDRGSFDENNVFHSDEPMTMYEPEQEVPPNSTYYRFWAGMWMLHNNYGQITPEMVKRELGTAHFAYDRLGNRSNPDSYGIPTVPGTFCAHNKPFSAEHPLGLGGNTETTVFNPSTLDVWWVPVWPCHYNEWNLEWNYLNLNPFTRIPKGAAQMLKK